MYKLLGNILTVCVNPSLLLDFSGVWKQQRAVFYKKLNPLKQPLDLSQTYIQTHGFQNKIQMITGFLCFYRSTCVFISDKHFGYAVYIKCSPCAADCTQMCASG